jgi:hypothetical protein
MTTNIMQHMHIKYKVLSNTFIKHLSVASGEHPAIYLLMVSSNIVYMVTPLVLLILTLTLSIVCIGLIGVIGRSQTI